MYETHIRPSADLRQHYNEISKLANEKNHVIITKNGHIDIIIIGAEEFRKYEAYIQEQYVLARLDEAAKELDDPKTEFTPHDEVWATLEKEWSEG